METGWSLRAWRTARAKKRLTPPAGAVGSSIFQDGLGTRWLAVDAETGDPVEILAFAPAFAESPDFAAAVGERVARLTRVRHTLYARARRLDRPSENSLLLYSDYVTGWRLADVLATVEKEKLPLDISAVLVLMRQLIPAVALFSRHQRDAAIGTIGPDRLLLTPQGRLVVSEYVIAQGLEKMQLSRERLWRDVHVTLPHAASATRIPPSADVVGIGIVALSLVLGRPLKNDEFLVSLGDLLEKATESANGETRKLSAGFSQWITRALQFDENTGFQTPHEAQVAFEEMLAKERAYVTTQTQLDLFVARLEKAAGPPPPSPLKPAPPAVTPPPKEPAVNAAPRLVAKPAVDEAAEVEPPAAAASVAAVATAPIVTAQVKPFVPAPAAASKPDAIVSATPASAGPRAWMTPPVMALGLLAIVEAAAIGWLLTRHTAPAVGDKGELVVQSRPLAARVTIDGEDRGITPLSTGIAAGAHIVEVRVGRSEPRVIPIEVRGGIQNSLYVELQSVATVGGLEVRTEPARARVTIDGRYRGDSPLALKDLAPGDHEVLLEAGKQKVKQTVRVEPGITSQLVVPMR